MAEDEAGFTFVDKRKVVAEDQASGVAVETPEAANSADATSDTADSFDDNVAESDVDGGLTPDVYMLLQYCVQLLAADAWQKMGLIANPQTGQVVTDLAQAKVAIDSVGDLIGRLESAPQTAVPESERRELRNVLNNLRLNYVNQRSASSEATA
jgi:hypothetical protein